VPQDFLDSLRGETRNLARIVAVLRGLVVDGQDQVTEFYGHWYLGFHGFVPFWERATRARASRVAGAFHLHPQLQQFPGHRLDDNEFSNLHRKRFFGLAGSFKVK
jgi:hypothetical protein